jgi:nucleotide-binding universal stress UspA family protein
VIGPDLTLLVPIIRAQNAGPLLALADALVRSSGGRGHVLGLVEIPETQNRPPPAIMAQRRHDLLRWIATVDSGSPDNRGRLSVQLRVSHNLSQGIREAVYETESNLLLVEWPGLTSRRPQQLSAVLQSLTSTPPTDLLLVRPDPQGGELPAVGDRILVPIRGGANARLALKAAAGIAQARGCALTVLHVHETGLDARQRSRQLWRFHNLVAAVSAPNVEVIERQSKSPAAVILEEAPRHRAVVLGAHVQPGDAGLLVRSDLASMVRALPGTVILARASQ